MDSLRPVRIVQKPRLEEAPSSLYSLPLWVSSRRILDYLRYLPRSPWGEYEPQDAIQALIARDGRVCGVMVTQRLTLTA